MGEYADDYVDSMIDSWWSRPRKRRPVNWQTGTGRFSWKDSDGVVHDMRKMSDEYLRNAMAECLHRGNSGKADDVKAVLAARAAAEFGSVDLED